MPAFGGMSPFPLRLGGGRPRTQVLVDALNADRGDAYDASTRTTTVYVEDMAIARAIGAAWGTNYRLGTLWDAHRMPLEILERWESILAMVVGPTDTEATRRAALAAKLAVVGRSSLSSVLYDALSAALGSVFVAVEYVSYAGAVMTVPDGSYPWGTPDATYPWSSTVARVLVRLQAPTGYTEGQFYAAAGKVPSILDPMLPVWVTFDWYRSGPISAPSNGISGAGFYLDDPHNLGNEVFA